MTLPRGPYDIVYADPPWWYYGSPNKDQAAGKHYRLMRTDDICSLDVGRIASKPSVLFIWATSSKLPDALSVMHSWGFTYRTIAYVWVKTTKSGRPLAGRGVRPTLVKPTTEFVLAGTTNRYGRPFRLLTERQPQVLLHPIGRHSQKPPEIRDRIVELLGDRPRVELFARDRVNGWDAWGDEV